MGQQYPKFSRLEQHIVVVLHIYRSRAIFLLYCEHQQTEFGSRGIYIGVYGKVCTNKRYQKPYRTKILIPHKMGGKNLSILHIYGVTAIFLLF